MRYRKLGNSNLNVSVIGQGTWAMGGDFFGNIDKVKCINAIHASLDCGVNLIDTAPAYGNDCDAEKIVGEAIKDRRDKVVLATKCGVLRKYGEYIKCLSPVTIKAEIAESLKRLQTEYIDIYLVHWPDYNFGIEGALNTLLDLKKQGLIREIGVSNFSVAEMQVAIKQAGITCIQPPFSMLNRISIENGIIPFAQEQNLGVLSYGSLGGGILSGKIKERPFASGAELRNGFYPYYEEPIWSKCQALIYELEQLAEKKSVSVAEITIAWTIAQTGITLALLGSTNKEQAMQNALAGDLELSADELKHINDVYKKIMG